MLQTNHQRPERRRGAAVIEFAIALPIFLLILLGTIETTSMIFTKQSLKIAAYEAARVAIVQGSEQENVEYAARNILTARDVQDVSVRIEPPRFNTAPLRSAIRVSASAPCSSNSFFPSWFYGSRQLSADATMMKEWE